MTGNDVFHVPIDMAGQNPTIADGIFSHMASVSLTHSDVLDMNNQNQIMVGLPMPSMLQGEPMDNLHAYLHSSSQSRIVESDGLVPRNTQLTRTTIRDCSIGSSCPINDAENQSQLMEGIPISAASIATLLASRCVPRENLENIATSELSAYAAYPVEVLKTSIPNDYNLLNSSFGTPLNSGYDGTLCHMSSNWDYDKFITPSELARTVPARTVFQPLQWPNTYPNSWLSSENTGVSPNSPGSRFGNELSLSLATCQPSVICGARIQDQCSELSSVVTSHSLCERGLGSEQSSSNSKSLSLNFGSYRPIQLSQSLSRSRYLHVMQEILADIASYSLESLDPTSYPSNRIGSGGRLPFFSGLHAGGGCSMIGPDDFLDGSDRFDVQVDSTLHGREAEAKKKHLLALLQVVDDRYNQCLDEIHTVVSAFHAVSELDPKVHARFAFQTILVLYKNLRERISNQILAMGAHFHKGGTTEEETSFETSFIQKQWALQQLRKKDHQLWRPQRGLPERSVSVLRAWMFKNFLHPYPKDAEKHLLAVKSGLTRSQVSNWFINARVRLWKPMIEEMYAEMNRRKGRRSNEDIDSNHRNRMSFIQNQRL